MPDTIECLVCHKPLTPTDEHAAREALKMEGETPETLGIVCPLCSYKGLDPVEPVEHLHLFCNGGGDN